MNRPRGSLQGTYLSYTSAALVLPVSFLRLWWRRKAREDEAGELVRVGLYRRRFGGGGHKLG